MARFDVYENPEGPGYLLDVQADLLSHMNTRVVVPLFPTEKAPDPAERLNPSFRVRDEEVVMLTQFLAAVPAALLQAPAGSLDRHHHEIVAAVDFLFQGF